MNICHECAIAKGAVPKGGDVTMHLGTCPYCKEEKNLSGSNDYKWPKPDGSGFYPEYVWDWD